MTHHHHDQSNIKHIKPRAPQSHANRFSDKTSRSFHATLTPCIPWKLYDLMAGVYTLGKIAVRRTVSQSHQHAPVRWGKGREFAGSMGEHHRKHTTQGNSGRSYATFHT
jgi:hypothetical protein